MSERGTDEFLDVRPSEEDEAPAPVDAADGAGDDMVFLDELGGPPADQGPGPRPPARRAPPPRPGGDVSPRTPPPGRPPTGRPPSESGRAARPGSGAPRPGSGQGGRPQGGPQRPPSGGPRPAPQGDVDPGSRTSSGRLRTLGQSGASPAASGKQGRPSLRPERGADEDAAALAALDARAQPTPAGDPFVGRDLGPFRVDRFVELDRGERRYVAVHNETQRVVLLRVFPLTGTAYADELKRVADRGERACRVESQSLDGAIAAGRTKEAFYAGFDPPAGPTLAELLQAGPLPEAEVLAALEQAGKGLAALHARELSHGHLSTDTIRRLRPGTYVVEAAGLARPRPALTFLAAGGDVLGRPGFIAPETVDSGEHTKASDLYSLGCVAWTALCGRPPFVGDDEVQVLLDQINHEVPELAPPEGVSVSEATRAIVGKLTGYTPDVRYRDFHDLTNDLKAREKGEKVTPFAPALRPDPDEQRPRAKLQGVAVSLIVLGVLNAILFTLVAVTIAKARAVPLDDPLQGLELPLPAGRK